MLRKCSQKSYIVNETELDSSDKIRHYDIDNSTRLVYNAGTMNSVSNDKAYNKNYDRLNKVGEKKGYVFNPNQNWVTQVIRLMTNNLREFGKYFCPCKQHYPVDTNSDIACPCPTLDQEVVDNGCCHCRLFFRKGFVKEKFDILATITCPG